MTKLGQLKSVVRAVHAHVHIPVPIVEAIHERPVRLRRTQSPTPHGCALHRPSIHRPHLFPYHKMLLISHPPIPTLHAVAPRLACHLDRGRSRMMDALPWKHVGVVRGRATLPSLIVSVLHQEQVLLVGPAPRSGA